MSSEKAAWIACAQEIEIACEALEEVGTAGDFEKIRAELRDLFERPGRDTAIRVLEALRRDLPVLTVRASVTVDGSPTTLEGLAFELEDLLNDD
ncbi:MAG: hypothetical protein ACOY3K_07210 [Candidatus Omnitrophota bacterium]